MLDQTLDNDIADPRTYADLAKQHGLYTQMRQNDPLHWTQPEGHRPFWTVTKHADIMEIERQPDKFLAYPRSKLFPIEYEKKMAAAAGGKPHFGRAISQMDPPDHKVYRQIAQEWFQPTPIHGLSPKITALADRGMKDLLAKAPACDFYKEIASPYPLRVIMLILGIKDDPVSERKIMDATARYFGGTDPEVGKGEGIIEATFQYFDYFEPLAKEKRDHPADDVASLIANARVNGEPIDPAIAQMYFVALAGAGHDTTGSTSAGGVLAMIQNPAEWDKLKANFLRSLGAKGPWEIAI